MKLLLLLDLSGKVCSFVGQLLGFHLVLHSLGHWVGVLVVEHASEVKFGSNEHSSVLVLDLVLSLFIQCRVSSFHLLVVSNSEFVKSSLALSFLNRFDNHDTNVNKGNDDEEDDIGVTHEELHGIDSDEVSVDHEVIDEDHNHELVEELSSNSLSINVWSCGSIPEEVEGIHDQEYLELHEWIGVEDGWDHNEQDSSKHRDWQVVLGRGVSVHVNIKVHVLELVSTSLVWSLSPLSWRTLVNKSGTRNTRIPSPNAHL